VTISAPTGILQQRAAGHRAELRRIEQVLRSVTAIGGGAVDSPVQDRFTRLFDAAGEQLDKAALPETASAENWERLGQARETVEQLSREVLAYVGCQLLAEKELDGGATAAAERLIASLTWRAGIDRPALLGMGDAECIDHQASIVHFRPLGTTAWQLPVIAHEIGHHVAARLEDGQVAGVRPVQVWLAKQSGMQSMETGADFQQVNRWLHELFADVFATYAIGAGYPLSVMAIRVDYGRVGEAADSHPPWSRRVAMMIAVLESMSHLNVGQTTADTYRENSRWLADRWSSLTDEPPGPEPGVQAVADGMVGLLAKHALPRLSYDITGPVDRLRADLEKPGIPPPPGATPAHVLNAAWAWRLRNPEADDTIVSARVLTRCAQAAL
jgi:hypothetical protein